MNRFFRWLFRRSEDAAPEAQKEEIIPPRKGGSYPPYLLYYGGAGPMNIATVYSCVKIISDSVASLPLKVMKMRDGIFVHDTSSRLHYLFTVQPNENTSAYDFWFRVIQNVLLDGNAYILPMYNPVSMDIDRLVLADSKAVFHDTVNDTYTFSDTVNGISGTYTEEEVIHIKDLTLGDPKSGVSVLTFARVSMDIASTGDSSTLNQFANGGDVRGIVSNNATATGFGEYTDDQLVDAAADIDSRFRHGERIVSVPGDVAFKQMSLSSVDMQFLESRKYTSIDICRFFRVPPSKVFADTSNNYKSVEMSNVDFLTSCLNPYLRRIESELLRKLFAPSLATNRKVVYDREALLATDLESKVNYQSGLINAGLRTVNELRIKEDLPPVEGGDVMLVSANLKSITQLLREGSANIEGNGQEESNQENGQPVRRPTHA